MSNKVKGVGSLCYFWDGKKIFLHRRGTQKPFQFVLEPNVWWEVVLNISRQVNSFLRSII